MSELDDIINQDVSKSILNNRIKYLIYKTYNKALLSSDSLTEVGDNFREEVGKL